MRAGITVRDRTALHKALDISQFPLAGDLTQETTEAVARAARAHTGATHALAVLIDLDDGPDRIDFGGTIWIAIATAEDVAFRRSRILGGREWVRLGRGRTGARLPAPLPAAAAGGRADRLREDLIGCTIASFDPDWIIRMGDRCFEAPARIVIKQSGEVPMSDSGAGSGSNRWMQLWLGVLCMVLIANLQYAWTLFVNPMHQANGWSIAEIQVAFSIFIATETWLTPIEGYIVDRLGPRTGPRLMITFGGVLVGIAWVINAYAGSLEMLYVGAAISGTGAGAIYATCVGNAVKWFPDRRGLAVGLTAAGFGAGAALTVIPIRLVIDTYGYASAFLWFGVAQGIILLIVAQTLHAPMPGTILPTVSKRSGAAIGTQLHQHGSAALAGVLAALLHVPPGRRRAG